MRFVTRTVNHIIRSWIRKCPTLTHQGWWGKKKKQPWHWFIMCHHRKKFFKVVAQALIIYLSSNMSENELDEKYWYCWIEVRKSGELAIYFESSNFGHMALIDWLPFLRWGHFGNYTYGPKMVTHFNIGGKWTANHLFASCFIHMAISHDYCLITFWTSCRGKLRWHSLIAHLKNLSFY